MTWARELLEFEEDTAGGMMNTEFVSLHEHATVGDALQALKQNEDLLESLNTMFLVDSQERLKAAVPLARLFLHEGATPLASLASENLVEVLLTLPVVDEDGKLAGVITADDVISVLRQR